MNNCEGERKQLKLLGKLLLLNRAELSLFLFYREFQTYCDQAVMSAEWCLISFHLQHWGAGSGYIFTSAEMEACFK